MLTYAEELFQEGQIKGKQEGEIKGEIKGKIEMIEDLLNVGVDWSVITSATGIDPTRFDALKEQLAQMTEVPQDPEVPSSRKSTSLP